MTFPRKCNFVSNAYLQIWGREIWGKEKKRYEARVWIWCTEASNADSPRLSRRWELTAELAALMDLTRLNYRPFRRRQYARKGAMETAPETYQRFQRNGPIQKGEVWTVLIIVSKILETRTWKNFTFERISDRRRRKIFIFLDGIIRNGALLESIKL